MKRKLRRIFLLPILAAGICLVLLSAVISKGNHRIPFQFDEETGRYLGFEGMTYYLTEEQAKHSPYFAHYSYPDGTTAFFGEDHLRAFIIAARLGFDANIRIVHSGMFVWDIHYKDGKYYFFTKFNMKKSDGNTYTNLFVFKTFPTLFHEGNPVRFEGQSTYVVLANTDLTFEEMHDDVSKGEISQTIVGVSDLDLRLPPFIYS